MSADSKVNPLTKLALDFGPLVLFFLANSKPALFLPFLAPIIPAAVASGERAGIFVATAVFMVAMTVSIVLTFAIERKVSPMPLLTFALVLIFGGLTLWLSNENFIKIKPTILEMGGPF